MRRVTPFDARGYYYYYGSAAGNRRVAALGGAFSPLSLSPFAWYDPSDLSTLFQSSTGTGAVTTDGDPVGYMGDKSGNGNHLIQPTSDSRPVYKTSGGLHWLEFDGTDDVLVDAFTFNQPLTRMTAVRLLTAADNDFINSGGASAVIELRIDAGRNVYMNDGAASGTILIGNLTADTDFVVTEEWDGANSQGALDNAAFTAVATAGTGGAGGWSLGAAFNASLATNMRFHGGVGIARILTDTERASLRTYLAAKQGRSL